MKKIVLIAAIMAVGMIVSGCAATDKVYENAKGIYGVGKSVYKVLPAKSNTLEAIDATAQEYDKVRTIIREE